MKRTVDDSTVMSVHAHIKYKKSVWGVIKGFIEKNTWLGLEDFYESLSQALMTEYNLPPAKAKSRRNTKKGLAAPPQASASSQPVLPANQHERDVVAQSSMPRHEHNVKHNARVEMESTSRDSRTEILSWVVVVLLVVLIAFNVILYVKLWRIDESYSDDNFVTGKLDILR